MLVRGLFTATTASVVFVAVASSNFSSTPYCRSEGARCRRTNPLFVRAPAMMPPAASRTSPTHSPQPSRGGVSSSVCSIAQPNPPFMAIVAR
jgi:hypothetical protein